MHLFEVDEGISVQVRAIGGRFHRFCDDFVLSIPSPVLSPVAGEILAAAITDAGFRINEEKKLKNGFQGRKHEPKLHNLVVTKDRGIKIPKEQQQKALALAEGFVRGAKVVSPQSLVPLARKRRRLMGYLCHFRQADCSCARQLKRLIDRGDAAVISRLKNAGVIPHKNKWWILTSPKNNSHIYVEAWESRLA